MAAAGEIPTLASFHLSPSEAVSSFSFRTPSTTPPPAPREFSAATTASEARESLGRAPGGRDAGRLAARAAPKLRVHGRLKAGIVTRADYLGNQLVCSDLPLELRRIHAEKRSRSRQRVSSASHRDGRVRRGYKYGVQSVNITF